MSHSEHGGSSEKAASKNDNPISKILSIGSPEEIGKGPLAKVAKDLVTLGGGGSSKGGH